MTEKKKLTDNQKKAKSIIEILRGWFTKQKKEIYAIRVIAGTQKFWCRNPKKIKYWKSLAEKDSLFAFNNDSAVGIRITKVLYK